MGLTSDLLLSLVLVYIEQIEAVLVLDLSGSHTHTHFMSVSDKERGIWLRRSMLVCCVCLLTLGRVSKCKYESGSSHNERGENVL